MTAQEVLQVYQATGGTVDAPPSVTLTAPSAGASLQRTFIAAASASDDVAVAGVQFNVDGVPAGAEDTTAPYSASIDTTLYAEGQHTLTALARDSSGNLTSSAGVSVVFDNIALMPLGDSYTYGYVSSSSPNNDDGGYRRYLWEKLRANAITNVNFVGSQVTGIAGMDRDHEGHNGWRIDEVDAQIAGWLSASQPDTMLVMLGNNDLIQGATPALALSRMGPLLDKIHGLRPSARLIVSNLPGTRPNSDFPMLTAAVIGEYNSGVAALVSNRAGQGWNISFVDLWAAVSRASGSSDFSADGMHLSLSGYSKFADLWYAALYPGPVDSTPPGSPTGLSATTISQSADQPVLDCGERQRRRDGLSDLSKRLANRQHGRRRRIKVRGFSRARLTPTPSRRSMPPTTSPLHPQERRQPRRRRPPADRSFGSSSMRVPG